MNEKLTIQELINLLAQRHDMDQTDAETFVKTFFALIEEALENDKYVKIKGLGTFKLVEVDTRESIDVNTGERIEIMGHNRITFTPDTTMRDLVNKPFSHFETVVLNENTRFDDMDESGREIGEPDADDEDEAVETVENPDMNPNQGEMENDNIPTEEKTDVHPETDPVEEEQQPSEETGGSKESSASKRIFRLPWCMIATVLLIGILVGGGIVWEILSGRRYIPESIVRSLIQEEQKRQPVSVQKDTITTKVIPAVRIVQKKDTDISAPIPLQQPQKGKDTAFSVRRQPQANTVSAKKETLADTVEYTITGTQGTYTIQPGESLVKVSLKFYGNKKLWPYLVRHNKDIIKDADNIPKGITIRIPVLTPKSDKKIRKID